MTCIIPCHKGCEGAGFPQIAFVTSTEMNHSTPILLLLALLAGCASSPDDADETLDWSAERLHLEARNALDSGDYETAIKNLEKLEARFPFGRFAQQAQLETAYAYYKSDEVESAIAAADRFIKLHPTHPAVDYAYYLKGLAAFQDGIGGFEKLAGKNPTHMDAGLARKSYDFFGQLVKKYPDSRYTPDATKRMVWLRNQLAGREIEVAAYYLRRGIYVAAANRARFVIEYYARTPAVADALDIMARAYHATEMDDLARDSLRVFELNFPTDSRVGELKELLSVSKGATS